MSEQQTEVVDEPDEGRYAIRVDGEQVGLAAYRLDGDTITFTHTEISPAGQGGGLGSALVKGALDDVRRRGLTVVPQCSFVRAWIAAHPDYAGVVTGR